MDCRTAREQMGPWLDGELPSEQAAALQAHLLSCAACGRELERTRSLIGRLTAPATELVTPPPQLWGMIERRLDASQRKRPPILIRLLHRPLAAAASIAVLLGVGAFTAVLLNSSSQTAQATVVDYQLLLDGLPDVGPAVDRFLAHYNARPMSPEAIQAAAAPMRFRLPPSLPGGFQLQASYCLQFGDSPGYAGRYAGTPGPMFVFFHPPVANTKLGVHRDCECAVAGKGGHCVQVGAWRLIHFTDPTTCHCVLSSLDEPELYPVLAAISPDYRAPATQP